jgi:hypothetical protein
VVVKDLFPAAGLIRANSVLELASQLSLVAGPATVGVLAAVVTAGGVGGVVGALSASLLAGWIGEIRLVVIAGTATSALGGDPRPVFVAAGAAVVRAAAAAGWLAGLRRAGP